MNIPSVVGVTLIALVAYGEKLSYVSVEHPAVTYHHPQYMPYANLTSRRFGRNNPVYYVGLNIELRDVGFDDTIQVDIYFYEFLTNQYKRSFVELHFKFCQLLNNDPIFGAPVKRALINAKGKSCPLPPGVFNLANMTIHPTAIPPGFPFNKGRIYANFTFIPKKLVIGAGYIDMEIKQMKVTNKTGKSVF